MPILDKFLLRSPRKQERSKTIIPNNLAVWAVGDVHGRSDLLDPLIDYICDDISDSKMDGILVFLGDYIDRGPDSKKVIDSLIKLSSSELDARFIRGNHEDRMCAFLEDSRIGQSWCKYGGLDTLKSYGLTPPTLRHRADDWRLLAHDLAHALKGEHMEFLGRLQSSVSIGDYFFTHAGARPRRSLEAQSEQDLMWIRNTFLSDSALFEKVIVHGHTPAAAIYSDSRRIGLDTGAYKSGRLSAVRLQGEDRMFVQSVEIGRNRVEIRVASDIQPVARQ